MQLVKQLIHGGDREGILHSDGIKSPIICTESPGSIFLFHQDDWRRERALAWLY